MDGHTTWITAHAGAENTPANTLESIRILADCGADAIEVDVRRHEGRLILSHNAPENGEQPDALEDCLRIVAAHPGLKVNLDLKQLGLVQEVYDLAVQCGAEGQLILTGDVGPDDMAAVRAGNLTVWYNDSLVPQGVDLLEGVQNAGFDVLNICHKDVTDAMFAQPGRLSLWTVSDEVTLARLMGRGLRNLTTRTPLMALRLRGMIKNFHRAWDAFPGSARLIDREGFVLAANDCARQAGFVEGIRCARVETANRHQGCLLRRTFETGEGQFDVSPSGLLRVWTPVSEWDGAMLHLSYKK